MDTLKKIALFLVFLAVQTLVLNHVHLFGFIIPLLHVYFVVLFQRNYPHWALLLWAFALGLGVDIFSNTPGVGAASLTLTALLQPYLLSLFVSQDAAEDLQPSVKTLGMVKYVYFVSILTTLFVLTYFTLEFFSFVNWMWWLATVVGSTVLTVVLIIVIENVRRK